LILQAAILLAFFSFFKSFAMERRIILLLFTLTCFTTVTNAKTSDSLAPYAIRQIVDEYYTTNVHEIEVINFGEENGHGIGTIDKLLQLGYPKIPMKITRDDRDRPKTDEYLLQNPTILLFDSPENFKRTQNRIVFQNGVRIIHPHVVYIHNATLKDIEVVLNKSYTIDKTVFLVNETRNSIDLATSFLFTPEACHENQFKVVNRFDGLRKRWESSKFFEEKYKNFHGCTLAVFIDERLKSIPFEFAEALNFTISTKKLLDMFSITTTIFMKFGAFFPTRIDLSTVYLYEIETRKIYIPPGEIYGNYEKMFLPFDLYTWIAISLTVFMSIAGILLIKLFSPRNQELYFGRNNRSPLMNLISIFINGSQATNIIENTPRVFLLTFMFWSLIFR
jgi:hypothetical protein